METSHDTSRGKAPALMARERPVMDHVSPLTITIMLACYVSPRPHDYVGFDMWDSPASREVRAWLNVYELIDDQFNVTEKGNAWVAGICAVPLPVQEWKIPKSQAA